MAIPSKINELYTPKVTRAGEKVYVRWDTIITATSYIVERKIDDGMYQVVSNATNSSFYEIVKPIWNVIKYRVKAINADGESSYTESENIDVIYIDIDNNGNGKLFPFDMLINFNQSHFDIIPNINDTEEEFIGVDGTYSVETKYEPRLFEIMAYSNDLTLKDRNELISKMGVYFDKLKTSQRYLRYNNKLYLVKIADKPDIEIYPTWVEINISFKAYNPYGYSQLNVFNGEGTIEVEGDREIYPTFIITDNAVNPIITINGENYSLLTTLSSSDIVTIDCENKTVVLNGDTNILEYWGINFPSFDIGDNTLNISDGNIKTLWKNKYISL